MEITNVLKHISQSTSSIGPIIKDSGFEEMMRYNKNYVIDSITEDSDYYFDQEQNEKELQ
jgi:Ni,Fe-hydrogenase III large subunit